ncbi:MAG: hypothetical protein ACUVTD_00695 [Nitrososphaerales archaeon]
MVGRYTRFSTKRLRTGKNCKEAEVRISQEAPREFYENLCKSLSTHAKIAKRACFIGKVYIAIKNPIKIKKIVDKV